MGFAMMATAEWHGELIADFVAKCRWLRESEMVSICRAAAANETSLLGDRLDMLAVANAP
jgi:IS4 transposase